MSITPGSVSTQIHHQINDTGPPRSALPFPTSAIVSSSVNNRNTDKPTDCALITPSPPNLTSCNNSSLNTNTKHLQCSHDINIDVTEEQHSFSSTEIPVILDPSPSSTSFTVKPRSKSKRASSTASESERNKFRSRLEMFSISSSGTAEDQTRDIKLDLSHDTVVEEDDDDEEADNVCILPSNEGNFTTRNSNSNLHQFSTSSESVTSNGGESKTDHPTKPLTPELKQRDNILRKISEAKISPLSPNLQTLRNNPEFDLSCGLKAKQITLQQYKAFMNWHYSHPIPDCSEMFPWLHGLDTVKRADFINALMNYTSVTHDNHEKLNADKMIPFGYRGLIPVRSCSIREKDEKDLNDFKYHPNSGVLRGSCEISEILHGTDFMGDNEISREVKKIIKDLKFNEDLKEEELSQLHEIIITDCKKLKVLPYLKKVVLPKNLSLRNFQIQVSKISQISDFIVYCFNNDHLEKNNINHSEGDCSCASAARLLYCAQLVHSTDNTEILDRLFTTLIIDRANLSFFDTPQTSHLLNINKVLFTSSIKKEGAICSEYDMKSFVNWDSNYLLKEKLEIAKMSSATKIGDNVWMGNSTDIEVLKVKGYHPENNKEDLSNLPLYINPRNSTVSITKESLEKNGEVGSLVNPAKQDWKLLLNCCDGHGFPDLPTLKELLSNENNQNEYILLNFPPSGSIGIGDCSDSDLISILNTCKLIYTKSTSKRPTLIYCSDGYTESSLLGVCYLIYVTGRPLTECLIDLHSIHGRPFFLFPTDVTLISRIEDILIQNSPLKLNEFEPLTMQIPTMETIYSNLFSTKEENWCTKIHGSLPSRVLSHLYLGSLAHAESIEVLEKLGISRVVSVGEEVNWLRRLHSTSIDVTETIKVNENFLVPNNRSLKFPIKQLMTISNVQDDGIDPLTSLLPPILDFIEECYKSNEKVLIHCRVGVSRSATVCIAEVMKRLDLNLIRSYFYVRVRRLNIIIQPNLRFFYELVKWEETQRAIRFEKNNILQTSKPDVIGSIKMKTQNQNCNKSISSMTSVDSLLRSSVDLENISLYDQLKTCIKTGNGNISPIANGTIGDESLEEEDEVFYDDENDSYGSGLTRSGRKDLDQSWLRVVDWHVLCRQIDQLNKAYIRSN